MADAEKNQGKQRTQKGRFPLALAHGEWPVYLVLTLLILLAFGLISLFSASHVSAYIESGDSYEYITKQGTYALFGLIIMFAAAMVDYHWLDRWVWHLYVASVILLLIVHFTCDPLNGATRWLYWEGVSFPSLQVSEVAKFSLILLGAHLLCIMHKRWASRWIAFFAILGATGLVALFVYKQPHLSGTIIILAIVLTMMVMSGMSFKHYVCLAVLGTAFGLWAWWQLMSDGLGIDYVSSRLDGWTLDVTQMEWQTMQSVYAIGSGGLFGLGFGNGIQKQMWLPEATNDFIFSVICEELGFVGALVVIFLFVALIVQGFYIAFEASDMFGSLIAIGITSQIAFQFAFNIGVVTSLLPNTGISLPFFSSGVTSLLMLLGEMGVLISIARDSNDAKRKNAPIKAQEEAERHAEKVQNKQRARSEGAEI